MTDFPTMRAAFRTTVSGGGKYEMVFRFPSMDGLHAADDEWRAALATPASDVADPDFREYVRKAGERLAPHSGDAPGTPTRDALVWINAALHPVARASVPLDCPIAPNVPASDVAPVGDYHVTAAQYEAAVKGRQDFRQAYREQLELLSQKEWAAVAQIGADQELSTRAVLRQAVRLYQLHHDRLKAGETFSWSGDEQRAKDFAGPLYAHPVDPAGGEALREVAAKYADMGIDERAEAMADNCDGDPWELIGYFREKLRQSQARVDAANNAATGFAKKLAAQTS